MTGPETPAGEAKKADPTPSGDDLAGPLSDLSMGTAPAGEDKAPTSDTEHTDAKAFSSDQFRAELVKNYTKNACCLRYTQRRHNIFKQISQSGDFDDPEYYGAELLALYNKVELSTAKNIEDDTFACLAWLEQNPEIHQQIVDEDPAAFELLDDWMREQIGEACHHAAEPAKHPVDGGSDRE